MGDDLSRAILSPNHRVVGVVINAIDDRLSSAEQIRDDWTHQPHQPTRITPEAGPRFRPGGHPRQRPRSRLAPPRRPQRPSGDRGRWRPKSQDLAEDEIVVTGRRVKDGTGGNSIIVPWSERVYYGRQQNGYHGGATPQEMVCPLVFLKDRSSAYSGLFRLRAS